MGQSYQNQGAQLDALPGGSPDVPACAIDFSAPSNEPSVGPPRAAIDRETKRLAHRPFKALLCVGLVRTFYEIEVGPGGAVQLT